MKDLQPQHGIIIVKKHTVQESGVIQLLKEDELDHGVVLAVGPGEYQPDGVFKAPTVNVGDEVVVSPGAGIVLDVDGEDLLFVTQNEIEGIIRCAT